MFFVIIIYLPIIICDIYYGYTDTSCVNEYPNELDVNMKMYLFISALVGISINFAYLYNITLITRKHTYDQNICVIIFPSIVIAIGSIFLVRVGVARAGIAISEKLKINSLFALCASYTLPIAIKTGFKQHTTLDNGQGFPYPTNEFRAYIALLDDTSTLKNAQRWLRSSK